MGQKNILIIERALETIAAQHGERLTAIEDRVAEVEKFDNALEFALRSGAPPPDFKNAVEIIDSSTMPLLDSIIRDQGLDAVQASRDFLEMNGVLADAIKFEDKFHEMSKTDIAAAVAIGALTALLPSLPISSEKQSSGFASFLGREQEGSIGEAIDFVFGDSASFKIDETVGKYHRFDFHGHDIFSHIIGQLFGDPAQQASIKVIIGHLLKDSFGSTGIPLPGSTYIRSAVESLFGISTDNRTHSRFGGIRITDLLSTGATSLLLVTYEQSMSIPASSMRRNKIAFIAHLMNAVMLALIDLSVPGQAAKKMVARRSLINHPSLSLALKNLLQLGAQAQELRAENQAQANKLSQEFDSILLQFKKEIA